METGGFLLGLWSHTDSPTVFLATRPGPGATQAESFLELCPDVYKATQELVWTRFGIQVVGFWHSHHRLGIPQLSGGDVLRTMRYSRRTRRDRFCEILGFFDRVTDQIGVRPYVYQSSQRGHAVPTALEVIPGISPIRQAIARIEQPASIGDAFAPGPGPMWPPPRLLESQGFEAVPASHRPPEDVTDAERPAIHRLAQLMHDCVPQDMHDAVTLYLPRVGRAELTVDDDTLRLDMKLETVPALTVLDWRIHSVGRDAPIAKGARSSDVTAIFKRAITILMGRPPPPLSPPESA